MTAPSEEDPEREKMGISLSMNSALRGIRRARIHDLMNPRTVSFHGSATKYHTTQRAQGSEVRPSEFLLLRKGNPVYRLDNLEEKLIH